MAEIRLPLFNISAAVVKQLGEELVSDEVTAIMELVKNSYDADATWVRVEINTKNVLSGDQYKYSKENGYTSKGYITIEDDGIGMSKEEIINKWLVISFSNKRGMKERGETTNKGRTPLGDKGLGRLSTQRLGQYLEMVTTKENENTASTVSFNWSDFTDSIALSEVPVDFKEIIKARKQKGTKLIINNIKDIKGWEGDSGDRFRGQLSQLIFPFKENRAFSIFLVINNENVDLDELNNSLRNQAVSRFKFEYDGDFINISGAVRNYKLHGSSSNEADIYNKIILADEGKDFFNFLTDKQANKRNFLSHIKYEGNSGWLFEYNNAIDINDLSPRSLITKEDGESDIFADPGKFWGEIDDFNLREAEVLNRAFDDFSQYKNIVKNQVGIRIFRDGFGIKPYGIDGFDWLNLSKSQTSGGSFYTLRPGNTIGFVALTSKDNRNLKEKTDREGFVDSPYSKNFMRIMSRVVNEINSLLENTRRSYNDYKKEVAQKNAGITNIKDSFKRIYETSEKAKKIDVDNVRVSNNLKIVSTSIKDAIKESNSLGTLTEKDKKQRELLIEVDSLLIESKIILDQVDSILKVAKTLEYDARYLQPKIEDLENQLSQFSELAGLGLVAEALSHEISNIVDRLLEQTNNISKKVKGSNNVDVGLILVYVEYVRSSIKSFRKQLSHLSPSLKYVRETVDTFSLQNFVEEIKSYYEDRFKSLIDIHIIYGKQDFYIKMNKGKLTQVIDNIVLNSEFWLKNRLREFPDLVPVITIELSRPFLRIWDNGQGIDASVEDRIFQPFITSKPKQLGRGLGLFIVQQLLDTVGCDVSLLNQRNEFERRFIFQINLAPIIIE